MIHYCWFGNTEIPSKDRRCIESWKKHCPDYEIKRWDETNYDITQNEYMRQAYEQKKWGFVPDYARLDIIYKYGGIYLDTDVEIIKSLDDLLKNKLYMGFEKGGYVNPGLGFGAERGNEFLYTLMHDIYDLRQFVMKDGRLDLTPSPILITRSLMDKGIEKNGKTQETEKIKIYAADRFCPEDHESGQMIISKNTYSIHHYHASWVPDEEKKALEIKKKLLKKYGKERTEKIYKPVYLCYRLKMHFKELGMIGTVRFMTDKIRGSIWRSREG